MKDRRQLEPTTHHLRPSGGFTLAEALISVGLAAIMLAVFSAVFSATVLLRRTHDHVQAASFVQEEIDSLRALPFTELLTRTNGKFLGLAMTRGPWKVKTVASPPSGTRVYAMETAQTAIIEETGLAVLPGNYRKDITSYVAKVQVLAGAPAGWGAGIAFRYRDAENHYRFRLSSGGAALDKIVQGTKTTVWSNSTSNTTGTWYTLEVSVTGNSILLKRNGTTLTTQTDNSLATGDLALLTLNGARAHFDDVSILADATTSSWNFDGDADGTVPTDWQRLSVLDLPSGNGTLTIADYLGDDDVKQATVNVTWNDSSQTKTASGTTLLTK